ncbi:MAG: alkaline phosphatase D family protein [Pikeienuella sp.]
MLTRRTLLGIASAAAPLLLIPRAWGRESLNPFTLGVASGMPTENSAILWTRLAVEPLKGGGMPAHPVAVRYRVCTDPDMTRTFREGEALAEPEFGHSVHLKLEGLRPGQEYWYQFFAGTHQSPIGRTKAVDPRAASTRLALGSCQHYEHGYFSSYRDIAEWAPDAVLFVGDYFYEYAAMPVGTYDAPLPWGGTARATIIRTHGAPEPVTLMDYRNRYALYKMDPDLQLGHAAAPWVICFDDHEIANDWAGYSLRDSIRFTDMEFKVRRLAAFQAFYEHMPIEKPPVLDGLLTSFATTGSFAFGPAFVMLTDTRQNRDPQSCGPGFPSSPDCGERRDPNRMMADKAQEEWLRKGFETSQSPFTVMATQTWFSPYDYDGSPDAAAWNMDQWDGYPEQRARLMNSIAECQGQPIVLSGDWHCAAAMELRRDPFDARSDVIAHEFAGTSLAALCLWDENVSEARAHNKHVSYSDGTRRGYLRCTVDRGSWTSTYRVVDDPTDQETGFSTAHEVIVPA